MLLTNTTNPVISSSNDDKLRGVKRSRIPFLQLSRTTFSELGCEVTNEFRRALDLDGDVGEAVGSGSSVWFFGRVEDWTLGYKKENVR